MAAWFHRKVRNNREDPAALVRAGDEFQPRTFARLDADARAVARRLLDREVEPGDRVGIRSETRYEWSVVDLGCHLAGLVLVPVYPTFSEAQATHVVEDAGIDVLVVEDDPPEGVADAVEAVVGIEALASGERERSDPSGEREERDPSGERSDDGPDLPGFDREMGDPATLVYTSGTTGDPKGVELTHRNLLASLAMIDEHFDVPGEIGTAFLPLSHVYQRSGNYFAWHRGAAVAFMSVDDLGEELPMVRPSAIMAVPRLYERIYDEIRDEASADGLRGRLLSWAMDVAREYGRAQTRGDPGPALRGKHWLADRLVYSTLRERLGLDRLRYSITGAASIDPELLHFFWGMGAPLLEGYGATELTTPAAFTPPERPKPGTVGVPAPGEAIRIADDGEILVSGPNVMAGYWNDPEATAEAIDDGWYHTGDLGRFDDDGYLEVLGRKKHFSVLDTGKNVAPERIEDALTSSRYVAEAMAVADGRKFVTAIVQPSYDALVPFARKQGIEIDEAELEREDDEIVAVPRSLLDSPAVRDLFADEVDRSCADLAEYECVGEFALLERALSIERGELTPTLKKRRETIREHYADRIEAMYD